MLAQWWFDAAQFAVHRDQGATAWFFLTPPICDILQAVLTGYAFAERLAQAKFAQSAAEDLLALERAQLAQRDAAVDARAREQLIGKLRSKLERLQAGLRQALLVWLDDPTKPQRVTVKQLRSFLSRAEPCVAAMHKGDGHCRVCRGYLGIVWSACCDAGGKHIVACCAACSGRVKTHISVHGGIVEAHVSSTRRPTTMASRHVCHDLSHELGTVLAALPDSIAEEQDALPTDGCVHVRHGLGIVCMNALLHRAPIRKRGERAHLLCFHPPHDMHALCAAAPAASRLVASP